MPRYLTERELRKIERWARANKKSELLDFFADLPRHIVICNPTLFGSLEGHDIFFVGYSNTPTIIREICQLDEAYTPIPSADSFTHQFAKNNDRTEQSDGALRRAISAGKGTRPRRICLASHLGGCNSNIVAAHSIQRSQLAKLARDGHVYGFTFGGPTDHRNFSVPTLLGIKIATTFTGVCGRHDTEIFKPIETVPFTGSQEELFLYHYRATLFGHYLRSEEYKRLHRIHTEMAGDQLQRSADDLQNKLTANAIDLPEVTTAKEQCDRAHSSRSYSTMLLKCWVSESPPPIAGTVLFAPQKDFCGVRIQRAVGRNRLHWATLTITPKDGRTILVIGANSTHPLAQRFVDSLNSIPSHRRLDTLLSYSLCVMEAFAILPHFWEGLDKQGKEAIIRTYQARYFPRRLPPLVRGELIAAP